MIEKMMQAWKTHGRCKDNRPISVLCILFVSVLYVAFSPPAVASGADEVTRFLAIDPLSSALNPVGSGARAMGMGGAYIAVADDATAASWNPAGLVQLEKPELSLVYSIFSRDQKYSSSSSLKIDGEGSMNAHGLNHGSLAYPFVWLNRNMIVSLHYQRLYELDKKIDANFTSQDVLVRGLKMDGHLNFSQKGYLYALSPAFAAQVHPKLYLGMTLNLWRPMLGRDGGESSLNLSGSGTLSGVPARIDVRQDITFGFKGTNMHMGLLWMFHDHFTLGAVLKTPFDAKLKMDSSYSFAADYIGGLVHDSETGQEGESLTVKMPASYGIGLAYRHSDNWTVALDVYRTEWSKFTVVDSKGFEMNPATFLPPDEGRLRDTTQIRAGTEYLFAGNKYVVPLRFGIFYDPETQTESFNSFYGVSAGTGYYRGKTAFDIAYQYRWGRRVRSDLWDVGGSRADINQHSVMLSMIYYF